MLQQSDVVLSAINFQVAPDCHRRTLRPNVAAPFLFHFLHRSFSKTIYVVGTCAPSVLLTKGCVLKPQTVDGSPCDDKSLCLAIAKAQRRVKVKVGHVVATSIALTT